MVTTYSYIQQKTIKHPLCIVDNMGNENNIFVNETVDLLTFIYCIYMFIGITNKIHIKVNIIPLLKIILNDNTRIQTYSIIQKETFDQSKIKKIILPCSLKLECCICYDEIDFLKEQKYLNDIRHFVCTHYVCTTCFKRMMRECPIRKCPLCREGILKAY